MDFSKAYAGFFAEFGESRKMVLSTSAEDIVTSRTMSIIAFQEQFYFQTDKTFRKYSQLIQNPRVALCIDNIQIEGRCKEAGRPLEHAEFARLYQTHFLSSYTRYTSLENERLFIVTPTRIERWLYMDNVPYLEVLDIGNRQYSLERYDGV